jgi:hypothetical protein
MMPCARITSAERLSLGLLRQMACPVTLGVAEQKVTLGSRRVRDRLHPERRSSAAGWAHNQPSDAILRVSRDRDASIDGILARPATELRYAK